MWNGYGIAFDGKDKWNFGNDSAWNVLIFGVGNSSSPHTNNGKKDFLLLGEGDTFDISSSFGGPEKKSSINFSKAKTKFFLICHYNGDNNYLFINEKKSSLK